MTPATLAAIYLTIGLLTFLLLLSAAEDSRDGYDWRDVLRLWLICHTVWIVAYGVIVATWAIRDRRYN